MNNFFINNIDNTMDFVTYIQTRIQQAFCQFLSFQFRGFGGYKIGKGLDGWFTKDIKLLFLKRLKI